MAKTISPASPDRSSTWEIDVTKLPILVVDKDTGRMQHTWVAILTNAQRTQFETKLFPLDPTGVQIADWLVELRETLANSDQLLTDNSPAMISDAVREVLGELRIELRAASSNSAPTGNAAERIAKKIKDALAAAGKSISEEDLKKLIDQLRQSRTRKKPGTH